MAPKYTFLHNFGFGVKKYRQPLAQKPAVVCDNFSGNAATFPVFISY
jgi:hypothetical protein